MKRGRKLNMKVRAWVISRVTAYPQGVTITVLRQEFRKTDMTAFRVLGLLKVAHELAGSEGYADLGGYGKPIHIAGWEIRKNEHNQKYSGGKLTPIFKLGPGKNAPYPPPSPGAIYQRKLRDADRLADEQHEQRLSNERRRALKRRPVMDALTAALFLRPNPSR